MKTQLHKTQQGFIVTSDEKPVDGELYWCKHKGKGIDVGFGQPKQSLIINTMSKGRNLCPDCMKLIAQQHQLDFSAISEEKCKMIGWFDLDKLGLEAYPITVFEDEFDYRFRLGHKKGCEKMQELLSDRVFTLEDVANYLSYVEDNYHYHSDTWHDINTDEPVKRATMLFNFKKSLTPTTWEIIGEWIGDKYRITEIKTQD